MHPAYVDTSHFRAPYKNAYFGAVTEAPPAPPQGESLAPDGQLPANYPLEKRDGKYYFNALAAEQVLRTLGAYRYIFVGGPTERVKVVPYDAQQLAVLSDPSAEMAAARAALEAMNAGRWVVEKVIEDKVVLAPVWIITPGVDPNVQELQAIPAGQEDLIADSASAPIVAILAEPKKTLLASLLRSPYALAIGAAVLLGGAYVLVTRGKPSSRSSSKPFAG